MDIYKVNITEPVEYDIRGIVDYIMYTFDMPNTAIDFENRFKKAITSLSEMPEKYPPVLDLKGYRKIIVKNYIIFFRVDNINKIVTVDRVLHSSQNWLDILQSEESPCLTIS